ncbi:hypothetical protein [Agrobacterium vitis]|uniref:hypothetical protein n=1 Tax=Agrobacterium vitis TaxID=373 RepID=UPI001F22782B|nr:hypothetical protein [Agrobacterium vitis]
MTVLVAIMFLVAPMAEAAPTLCNNDLSQVEHIEASKRDVAGQGDHHPVEQKACCKGVCSLCNVILPVWNPVVLHLDSGSQRYLDPQASFIGSTCRPPFTPPRSLV